MRVGKKTLKLVGSDKPESPQEESNDLGELYLTYDPYVAWAANDEPDAYAYPIRGGIELDTSGDADRPRVGAAMLGTVAGRFDASYIHADNAFEDGVSFYDVMDATTQETADIYDTLYDSPTNELMEEVIDLLGGDYVGGNLLVINRVEILPAYRGMGLGLATMWHLIRRHSAGCGIVAIKAYPLQFMGGSRCKDESDWDKKMAYDSFRSRKEVAQRKLISNYKKLGFETVGDEGVMVLSTTLRNPIPKEIHRWVPGSALRKPLQP